MIIEFNHAMEEEDAGEVTIQEGSEKSVSAKPPSLYQPIHWIYNEKKCRTKHNPVNRYRDVVQMFGDPTVVLDKPRGRAFWDRDTLMLNGVGWIHELLLEDECVEHAFPAKHHDFYYATYKTKLSKKLLTAMRSTIEDLTGSVFVDPLEQTITARCHFMGANVATLYLAMLIATNQLVDVEEKELKVVTFEQIEEQVTKIVCKQGEKPPIDDMKELRKMVNQKAQYKKEAKKVYAQYITKMATNMGDIKEGTHIFYNQLVRQLKKWIEL